MEGIHLNFESEAIEPIGELPFHEDEIEGSEEMRAYRAKEYGLSDNASWEEVSAAHEKAYISKLATALGLDKEASHEEVMAEESRLGVPNAAYFLELGVGLDATGEEVREAINREALKKHALLKEIAEEMVLNRAKNITPQE